MNMQFLCIIMHNVILYNVTVEHRYLSPTLGYHLQPSSLLGRPNPQGRNIQFVRSTALPLINKWSDVPCAPANKGSANITTTAQPQLRAADFKTADFGQNPNRKSGCFRCHKEELPMGGCGWDPSCLFAPWPIVCSRTLDLWIERFRSTNARSGSLRPQVTILNSNLRAVKINI